MERLRLRLLGKPELVDEKGREVEEMKGVPLALLAYLLLQGRPVGRDHLAQFLWPGPSSRHSRHSLRQVLFRLRACLPEGTIKGSEELSASPHALTIDVFEVSALIRDHRVEEALDLWRGPFLSGFRRPESWEFEEWIEQEQVRLDGLLKSAVTTVANAWMEEGEVERSLELLGRARTALPQVQEIAVLEVRALAEAGRVHEAEGALAAMELDHDGGRLQELEDDIERARTRLEVPSPPPMTAVEVADAGKGDLASLKRPLIRWPAMGVLVVAALATGLFLLVGIGTNTERTNATSEGRTNQEGSLNGVSSGLGMGFGPEQFQFIPAGTFQMGGPTGDTTARPVHSVTIAQPFYMQKTEVTQGQWQAVMGSNPSTSTDCGDTCPVETVGWNDVQTFLVKLNEMYPGAAYRLPTEAEWEYAARAGTASAYHWGEDVRSTCTYGNVGEGYEYCTDQFHRATAPVGSFVPNPFGLHDIQGNVFEWTEDCWSPSYVEAPTDGSPQMSGDCGQRVLRGGSWKTGTPQGVRSAYRDHRSIAIRDSDVGFRLVRAFSGGVNPVRDWVLSASPDSPDTPDLQLKGVWGTSDTDIWAVGELGTILHFDGTAWESVPSPVTDVLYAVWGTAADNIFAVGGRGSDHGVILSYDGTHWSAMTTPGIPTLTAVWGSSASDIYAVVGGYGPDASVIAHFDGAEWATVDIPAGPRLEGIWGASSHDVWAVGRSGRILHFDGKLWTSVPGPVSSDLWAIWGSSWDNIWAVGSLAILHYDGSTWSIDVEWSDPYGNKLWAIWGSSAGDVHAGGDCTRTLYFDGSTWARWERSACTGFVGLWGTAQGDLWGVSGAIYRGVRK